MDWNHIVSTITDTIAKKKQLHAEWMKNTFNMNYIKPWFEEHRSLRIDHGMRIYSLMNLAMWQKHWFD